LNAIPGIVIPEDGISRRPSIDLSVLTDPVKLEGVLDALDWALEMIKRECGPHDG
jgi:hypothetical protein